MLGEHQEELAVARRARRLFPKLVNLELPALAALGRTEEVQALLEQSETGKACSVLRAGGDLLLHDHLDPASQLLDRGIMQGQAWLSTLPTDTTSSHIGYNITCLADMLLLRGRVDEARVVLEQAVEQRADRPSRRRSHIGTLGIIAGMQGDRRKGKAGTVGPGGPGQGIWPRFEQRDHLRRKLRCRRGEVNDFLVLEAANPRSSGFLEGDESHGGLRPG